MIKLPKQVEGITHVNYIGYHLDSSFYKPGLGYEEITRKYEKDYKAGVYDQYNQNIKKIYYEECTVFWKDIQRRYEEEVSDSKILMMEMLANQTTNDDTR